MEVKSSKLKFKSFREKGIAPLYLLAIVTLGIIIGGGAYWAYKNVGKKEVLPKTEEKISGPVETTETTKPTTEKAVETGGKTGATGETGGKQSTTPGSTAKSETSPTQGNFSKKGAVFAREDGWTLLWDEPGRMAMNVKLKFTDQSICILGGEKKDCALINMGPQSYDYASVEGNRDDGEVTVIKLEELKLPQ